MPVGSFGLTGRRAAPAAVDVDRLELRADELVVEPHRVRVHRPDRRVHLLVDLLRP